MKILLHICCAPCSIKCIENLRKDNDIVGYWYNPNIHPYIEHKNRIDTLEKYLNDINIKLIKNDVYDLKKFVNFLYPDFTNRCYKCYKIRLEEVAKYAKENGFDSFSTTLLISPYQKHDTIKEIGYELEKKYNIKFLYQNFRPYFKEGQEMAKKLNLYMQKYCGCIFSEEERYKKDK